MALSMAQSEFRKACKKGDLDTVKLLLLRHLDLDINSAVHDLSYTPLHEACNLGRDNIVSFLLTCPGIDVNAKKFGGDTPFLWACFKGRSSCCKVLLDDPRVNVNERDNHNRTPMHYLERDAAHDVALYWMASGREIDLGTDDSKTLRDNTIAVHAKRQKFLALLERFAQDPVNTRREARIELGWVDRAAEVFAMVVFLCDGLVEVAKEHAATKEARFFLIARRLPMELQMILCFRVKGTAGTLIEWGLRELAFKNLAKYCC